MGRMLLSVLVLGALAGPAGAQTATGSDSNDWRQNTICGLLFVPMRDTMIVNAKLPKPRTIEDLRQEFAPRTITRDRPMPDRKSRQRLTYSHTECEQNGRSYFVGSVRGTEDSRFHTGQTFKNMPIADNTVYDLTP